MEEVKCECLNMPDHLFSLIFLKYLKVKYRSSLNSSRRTFSFLSLTTSMVSGVLSVVSLPAFLCSWRLSQLGRSFRHWFIPSSFTQLALIIQRSSGSGCTTPLKVITTEGNHKLLSADLYNLKVKGL